MLNKVVLSGYIANEVDLRSTNNGKNVCRFQLATNRDYKDDQGNYPTDYITCVLWGQSAVNLKNWTAPGVKIIVTGKIRNDNYEAKDGSKRYTNYVLVDSNYGWYVDESNKDVVQQKIAAYNAKQSQSNNNPQPNNNPSPQNNQINNDQNSNGSTNTTPSNNKQSSPETKVNNTNTIPAGNDNNNVAPKNNANTPEDPFAGSDTIDISDDDLPF